MRYVVVILVVLACAGCVQIPDIVDPMTVMEWICQRVAYVSDNSVYGRDYWQTPERTLELKTGDCEDFCILFMRILHDARMDSELVIVESELGDHAMVCIAGAFYNPSTREVLYDRFIVKSVYSYEQAIGIAIHDLLFSFR